MFRKIVSNLPYSPALLSQLGFYAKRLQKEQVTRRLGLLFTALALLVQSFAMITPPEAALAANENNMIFNGVKDKQSLLQAWDKNTDGRGHNDIQQIFRYFLGQDFSRKDLENTSRGKFGSRDKIDGGRLLNIGRQPRTIDPEQQAHTIRDANGNKETIWARHLDAFDTGANRNGRGSMYEAFIGKYNGKWFAIMVDCGNLAFSDAIEPPSITPIVNVAATCREITGYAYDETNTSAKLKAYIYISGNGKTDRYEITANKSQPGTKVSGNHGFAFTVPTKYHTGDNYNFKFVALPAYSENQSKQIEGSFSTSACKPAEPIAGCESLTVTPVSEPRAYTLTTQASAVNGATINQYRYTVTDASGQTLLNNSYESPDDKYTTEPISLPSGEMTIRAIVATSVGDQTSEGCTKTISVTAPEVCSYNPELRPDDPACKPCPGDKSISIDNEHCKPEIIQIKSVQNITQNIDDANGTTASSGDRLQYNLYAENTGKQSVTTTFQENLGDVVEYADITDFGESTNEKIFNNETKTFTWENITLTPGETFQKTIVVQVKQDISATPQSVGDMESFDCTMGNAFGGSTTEINVNCPPTKVIENTVDQLPATGASTNIIFGGALLMIVTYFYMRTRQLRKEAKLIRKEFNYGTI